MVKTGPLSAAFVKTVTDPKIYWDGRGGHGLYLIVRNYAKKRQNGKVSKSWAQHLTIDGKRRAFGLGSYPLVTLAQARNKALENAQAIQRGEAPRKKAVAEGTPTFGECLDRAIAVKRRDWRHPRTEEQLRFFIGKYALPYIGDKPIDAITAADVLQFLTPLAIETPASARKTKAGLHQIFAWSIAQGLREGNPADRNISDALPSLATKEHHKALPFAQVSAAIKTIEGTDAWEMTKACFTFMVLTATRSGESRLATWDEIDMNPAVWSIPGSRMKRDRDHRVPLSNSALSVLKRAEAYSHGKGLIFPSSRDNPMSDSTVSKLLRDQGIDAVPHGFRSSFRDWCAENNIDRQIAEACLAHKVGNATEAAYLRSDMFDLRRKVMDAWADYLGLNGKE